MASGFHGFVVTSPGFRADFSKKHRERHKHEVWSLWGFHPLNLCEIKAQEYLASGVLKVRGSHTCRIGETRFIQH